MSNFVAIGNLNTPIIFTFGPIRVGTINQITCADGKIAGWKIVELLQTDLTVKYAIQIYDSSTGDDVALGLINSVPGADLLGGLFVTGCIPDKSVTDPECVFYRVDY